MGSKYRREECETFLIKVKSLIKGTFFLFVKTSGLF